jgi:hypothetical protein
MSAMPSPDSSIHLDAAEEVDALRNLAIPLTVQRAWEGSRFYRELYDRAGVSPTEIRSVADLSRVPIVRKAEVRAAGRDARCFPETTTVSHVQHTSGTTGQPFFFYRSAREARFINNFFGELSREARTQIDELPLTLVVSGLDWHGTPTAIPGNAFPIHCGLFSETYFGVAADLLRREFDFPGVTPRVQTLTGSNEILTFTSWCLERGIDCRKEFAVRAIQLTGFYLTSRWRALLAETWGAAVFDRYSMSEHFGGATCNDPNDGFRFDPHIAYELVDCSGTRPARDDEAGILLLTSLYPFVQLQPLIRYWTGDLFVRHPASLGGSPSFRFLGRESHALFHPDDPARLLLSGVDVLEALDGYPEVARTSNFREHSSLRYAGADGYPIFRGRYSRAHGRYVFRLLAEVVMPLGLFGSRRSDLEDAMRTDILKRSQPLATLVHSGEADFIVEHVPPGTLEIAVGTEADMLEGPPRAWSAEAV